MLEKRVQCWVVMIHTTESEELTHSNILQAMPGANLDSYRIIWIYADSNAFIWMYRSYVDCMQICIWIYMEIPLQSRHASRPHPKNICRQCGIQLGLSPRHHSGAGIHLAWSVGCSVSWLGSRLLAWSVDWLVGQGVGLTGVGQPVGWMRGWTDGWTAGWTDG